MYREDNAHKIRRGMAGRVKSGLSGGGQAFGYKADPANKGKLIIVEEEAAIVRRVFEMYATGTSPRAIAYQLNAERAPAPRGLRWNASTINGSVQRGNGILHNRLYRGEIVWNKVQMIKDPNTGKRLSRPNPESEWEVQQVPELRIVSNELWEQAQANHGKLVKPHDAQRMRRPKRMLSGLLRCGCCGAGMSTSGKDKSGRERVRCSAAKESGTCRDPKTFYLDSIEKAVITCLMTNLRKPDNLKVFVQNYQAERSKLAAQRIASKATLEADLEKTKRRVINIGLQIADGILDAEDWRDELSRLRSEKKRLETELQTLPEAPKVVTLLPAAISRFEIMLANLHEAMRSGNVHAGSEDAAFIRELVTSITVRKGAKRAELEIEIAGHLNALLADETLPKASVSYGGSGGPTR